MNRLVIAAALLSVGFVGVTFAQSVPSVSAPDMIIARQAGYDLMNVVVGDIKAGIASGADVKSFKDSALAIAKWGKAIPSMFPAGSDTGHETKALPVVWSDRAGFDKDAAHMAAAADKLAELAAADDKAGFATQFQALGAACGTCHRAYRAR
jgi:cytochrome c556